MLSDDNLRCRVCGYLSDTAPWGEDGKCPTYEICPCCGVEYGYEDSAVAGVKQYRQEWMASGAKWQDAKARPENWSLEDQLKQVPPDFR
tara:strand:- start:1725 stop:1991 length:267 start_codon:yes stop_codon:yes gene_type:complete